MVCPVCGYENLQGDDQCANCGADLRTSDIPHGITSFERMLTEVPLAAIDAPNCLTVDPAPRSATSCARCATDARRPCWSRRAAASSASSRSATR